MVEKSDRQRERRLEAARGYLLLDMPDYALTELRAIRDRGGCGFALDELRGEAWRQLGRYGDAIVCYEQALRAHPDDLSALLGIAWCYKRTDQLPRAIAAMEQAYDAGSDEPIVLYNLSCYFALNGDKTGALSWLGRALRMKPSLRKLIVDEADFDSLRDDPDFQFISGMRDVAKDS